MKIQSKFVKMQGFHMPKSFILFLVFEREGSTLGLTLFKYNQVVMPIKYIYAYNFRLG